MRDFTEKTAHCRNTFLSLMEKMAFIEHVNHTPSLQSLIDVTRFSTDLLLNMFLRAAREFKF